MADTNLVALLFQAQSLRRKPIQRKSPRSRIRILPDGGEVLRGAAYERRRREVLRRDDYRCVRCGSDSGVNVHYRQKRSILRDDRMENLITLCESCHGAEHQE